MAEAAGLGAAARAVHGKTGAGSVPTQIELRLLGRFAAHRPNQPDAPAAIALRKARALLAYLAVHRDGTVARETLADLLWGAQTGRSETHA